jgi:NAD(P)-dependent dehydrogenase (short-subunit alcohol dehydrogenase family)
MDLQLKGKRALVTGASKGLGREVATLFAAEGVDLTLVARDGGALTALAQELTATYGVAAQAIAADLAAPGAAALAAKRAGAVDILVNSAGAVPRGDLLGVDEAVWRTAYDLKPFGYVTLTRAVYETMKANGGGAIVNIIGVAGERFEGGYVFGAIANSSLYGFTQALGARGPKDNIRVNAVSPGPALTPRLEGQYRQRAKAELGDENRWRELFAHLPFGRPATPREVADAVAFLASPRAGYISGAILQVDGGQRHLP